MPAGEAAFTATMCVVGELEAYPSDGFVTLSAPGSTTETLPDLSFVHEKSKGE